LTLASRSRLSAAGSWLLPPSLAVLLVLPPLAAAAQVELSGTWHLLIHYTDDNTNHPEQQRWLDRVWAFERKASRLEWIEYPIAVFGDETGRFERRATGQYARTLGAWQPTSGQLQNIKQGVRVNTRGRKKKSLRGSDADGWNTVSRARAGSASVITYQEIWAVEGLPDLPVFSQEDLMGSARSETLEGVTRFETTSVEEGGELLLGTFERDGTRHGTFQLRRAGHVGMLEEKSQAEIQAQGARRGLATSQIAREMVREELQKGLQENGVNLTDAELDAIVTESITLYLQGMEGPALREELMKRLRERAFGWAKRGAVHDDDTRYRFPFDTETPRRALEVPAKALAKHASASVNPSAVRELEKSLEYVVVFDVPEGERVVAARAGSVVRLAESDPGDRERGGADVTVLHEDGSIGQYSSLRPGVEIEAGQMLAAGDLIGYSGQMGVMSIPMVVFGVFVVDAEGRARSLPVRFDDGSAEGIAPEVGQSYGGRQGARAP
jgi:murein DD-endopeptidase MepM/ murein hydrolase activator NlpD